jgi:hypothetical protein
MKKLSLLLIGSVVLMNLNACSAMEKMNDASKERAKRYMDEISDDSKKNHELWESEIYNVISIGMAKEDFENKLSEYILKREDNIIYFSEPGTKNKSRVTFSNGQLVKYERYGKYYGGIGPGVYSDQSFLLKNYVSPDKEQPK